MPPKQTLGSKHNKKQSNPQATCVQCSTSGNHNVHSTIQSSINDNDESSLDSHSISSTTDVVTITANDQYYVRVSKQILQNELKRKRINVVSMSELPLLEDGEVALLASTTTDWRLVLLDAITTDDLRQGCISLFDQVNSGLKLTLLISISQTIVSSNSCDRIHDSTLRESEAPRNTNKWNDNRLPPPHHINCGRFFQVFALPSAIIQPFCNYLQHLIAPPDSPADYHYGFSLFSKMQLFRSHIKSYSETDTHPEIQQLIDEMKKDMIEEFSSSLDLDSTWETFIRPVFWSDGTFSFKKNDKIVSSQSFPSTSLCALFVPARLHHAATILDLFQSFKSEMNTYCVVMFVFSGWFAGFFDAVTPSKLPFTSEFISLHTQLVELMKDSLGDIQLVTSWAEDDISRSNLNEIHLSFLNRIRNYLVHLSLHPFALVPHTSFNPVLNLFAHLFQYVDKNSLTRPFRDEMRKEMDAAALSSSSPPFILTSELVYRLTDEEKLKIVDRIVALSESDSPIDDGTTLRISTFHKDQLKSVYLPELFRKAGRTTEQYFHAFQSLLSLHHDCFDLCPINSLLKPNPNEHQPTSDEWDHIDLETIVVAIRTINDGHLSFTDSDWPLHNLALKILPQISNCATQMDQWQLERLLTPSINVLGKINFLPDSTNPRDSRDRDEVFLKVCRLCSQRVVSLCLGRMGFFSRFVSGLVVDDTSDECERVLRVLVNHVRYGSNKRGEKQKLRSSIPFFQEEGWQDALEFNFVQTSDKDRLNCQFVQIRGMMHFHGANIFRKISRYDTP
ncbi:hypothetical protein BLNAU_24759 [Blattamonas nauphoetae]|uniref:Uncharacterized protein n=1 Tax=Blattamonas nauphoetae TaxID=2049346 RepID=A0ABQ9WLW9_9EUKA|nr:hypothetical protein BLNAU_24759 [Blattamonas nauphoetae]